MDDRPVTRAQRGFGPAELAALNRQELRKLCHCLLLAEGATIEGYRTSPAYDEFSVTMSALWRNRQMTIRIYHRPVEQQDLDDLSASVEASGVVESLVIPARESSSLLTTPRGMHVIPPAETADRITASALTQWTDERPTAAIDRLELLLSLSETTRLLDPVGIQWLPSLALNELPPAVSDLDVQPQDLFERKTFRLLTASFRFDGLRYGERRRGERFPDSVLYWPDGSSSAAMIDCKAASSGYRMGPDHLLRFVDYWETLAPELTNEERELRYLIIVSSYFPGAGGERHPFHGRADELRERTGLELCYVTASDLAWAAAQVEAADMQLSDRRRIDWDSILAHGLVRSEHLSDTIKQVLG